MEQTFNQEPNLPHSDKTKDIFNRWIREEGTIDFSGGQYLVSRQRACKGENIYFGGKQNRTEENRSRVANRKKFHSSQQQPQMVWLKLQRVLKRKHKKKSEAQTHKHIIGDLASVLSACSSCLHKRRNHVITNNPRPRSLKSLSATCVKRGHVFWING